MPVAMTASRKFGISRDSLRQKHGPALGGLSSGRAVTVQAVFGAENTAHRTNEALRTRFLHKYDGYRLRWNARATACA